MMQKQLKDGNTKIDKR